MQSPFDAIPPRALLTIFLAICVVGAAIYCWRYLTHSLNPRDITLPPEDLSWKSRPQFYRSLGIVAVLTGLAVFVWTPKAEEFAKSGWLYPALLGIIGSYSIATVIRGWKCGVIQPLIRGVDTSFNHAEQPKRYWASLLWNAFLGTACLAGSLAVGRDNLTPECIDPDTEDQAELQDALAECNALAADGDLKAATLADFHAARGRIFQRLGRFENATEDYSRAIALDPRDSFSLHSRGVIHAYRGRFAAAIADLNASLALRPDNPGGYDDRAWVHALAGHRELAEKDFRRSGERAPPWAHILVRRAELAIERGDYASAVILSSEALATQPDDMLALQLRSEAYFELGRLEESARDDDRVRTLSTKRQSPSPVS